MKEPGRLSCPFRKGIDEMILCGACGCNAGAGDSGRGVKFAFVSR
jgi:hypothetical protein